MTPAFAAAQGLWQNTWDRAPAQPIVWLAYGLTAAAILSSPLSPSAPSAAPSAPAPVATTPATPAAKPSPTIKSLPPAPAAAPPVSGVDLDQIIPQGPQAPLASPGFMRAPSSSARKYEAPK